MTTGNAFGFLVFAAFMGFLPAIAPSWFPPTGFDHTSARALWLEVMSLVQGSVGSSFLVIRWVLPACSRLMALRTRTAPAGVLVPDGSTANII